MTINGCSSKSTIYCALFIIVLFSGWSFRPTSQPADEWLKIKLEGYAQGTTWQVTYYAQDSLLKKSEIDSILLVIGSSMSIL
jgi:thiamine biosynthesis lipoprotein